LMANRLGHGLGHRQLLRTIFVGGDPPVDRPLGPQDVGSGGRHTFKVADYPNLGQPTTGAITRERCSRFPFTPWAASNRAADSCEQLLPRSPRTGDGGET